MAVLVYQQAQDIKRILHAYVSGFFDGASHVVSGDTVAFPDCVIRMVSTEIPQDSDERLEKPLISFVMNGGDQVGQWKRSKVGLLLRMTKRQRFSFSIFVMVTEAQGGALQADLVTSLVKAIFESTEAVTLGTQGLKQVRLTPPSNLNRVRDGYYLNAMLLTFHVNLEYS